MSGEPVSREELWALQARFGCCEHPQTVVPGRSGGWMQRRKKYRDEWAERQAVLTALEARRVAACPDDPWMGGRTGTLTDRRGWADAAHEEAEYECMWGGSGAGRRLDQAAEVVGWDCVRAQYDDVAERCMRRRLEAMQEAAASDPMAPRERDAVAPPDDRKWFARVLAEPGYTN